MTNQNKPKKEELKCCICAEPIPTTPNGWELGNNAFPYGYRNNARCCDQCNWNIVIPTRIELTFDVTRCNEKNSRNQPHAHS